MEDAHVVLLDVHQEGKEGDGEKGSIAIGDKKIRMFGVFDGHGGE